MSYNFVNFVNLSKCDCYKWYTWPRFCGVPVLNEKFGKLQNSSIYNKIIKQGLGLICTLEETPAPMQLLTLPPFQNHCSFLLE